MICIRAFRAPDEPKTCEKFIIGHRHILEMYYGIIKITSDSTYWVEDEHTIVVIAEDSVTKKIYGGAKLQVFSGKYALPLQTALSKYDDRVHEMIRQDFINGGTGEICGLWNSKEVAGMGIGSKILSEVCIAMATQLCISSLFVLCAPSTVRMAYKMGLQLVDKIGNKGTFYYPKDNFIATLMKLNDVNDLSLAIEEEQKSIMSLRHNTDQVTIQKGPKGSFELKFDIKVPNWASAK